jgi:uncharacterized cofD-like protein
MIRKKIVVIGGGTGNFVVLSGLKKYYKDFDIVTIVDMTDDGGSNKKLIDEFGLLPTSDIKQCLVALSPETSGNSTLRQLFNYRFTQGEGIKGHHFGNLFMAALSDILGSQKEAIEKTQEILKIRGRIIPVSYEKAKLSVEYEDGKFVIGEHLIDEPEKGRENIQIKRLFTTPSVAANSAALYEIQTANLIVLCPGDLYTSILANIVVDGIAAEIKKSKAKKAYVVNLMTKVGQTTGFHVSDHLHVIEKYIGKSLNFVLVSSTQIPKNVTKIYKKGNEEPVQDDVEDSYFKVIRGDFLNDKIVEQNQTDALKRSLVRHDSDKLAEELIKLV